MRNWGTGKLWKCPVCGRKFANTRQMHSCGRWTVAGHFRGKPRELRRLFDKFLALLRKTGPVRVHAAKTRIAFITRMTFAAATPAEGRLKCHVILARRIKSPRFDKIEKYSPRCFGHYFHIRDEIDLDAEVAGWLAEAYRVGMQEQHGSRT
jgi:hypothetical protein